MREEYFIQVEVLCIIATMRFLTLKICWIINTLTGGVIKSIIETVVFIHIVMAHYLISERDDFPNMECMYHVHVEFSTK